jgi:hypothetical protein
VVAPALFTPFPLPLILRVWHPAELRAAAKARSQYDLHEPFAFDSKHGLITAPQGMVSDGASIPRIAWRYIDPEDPCILFASIVHDYLYSVKGAFDNDAPALTRQQCDEVLIEAMAASGARWDQRQAVYAAVRLFGGSHWKED